MRGNFKQVSLASVSMRTLALAAITAGLYPAETAHAQSTGAPPVRRSIDENGVDVIRATFNYEQVGVSIGPSGPDGLSYAKTLIGNGFSDQSVATIRQSGSIITVTLNGVSDSFVSGTYAPTEANGSTLSKSGTTYSYTASSGMSATFTEMVNQYYGYNQNVIGRATSVTYRNGIIKSYYYQPKNYCVGAYEGTTCYGTLRVAFRLNSVTNSNGYQMKIGYASDTAYLDNDSFFDWNRITKVTMINNAVEYCFPVIPAPCTLSGNWPSATYTQIFDANNRFVRTETDALNRTTRFTQDNTSSQLWIKRPGAATDNIIVTPGPNGVATVLRDGVTYNYSYVDGPGDVRTTTVTDAIGKTRVYVSDKAKFLLSSFKDELNRTTSYVYDTSGRVTEVTYPEGNKVQYSYDGRGNALTATAIAKAGTGLANIVTSTTYDGTCLNPKTCNSPNSSTDAKGNVTSFTYDANHGGVLTVTSPAPTSGAVQPQVRYGYAPYSAYYKDSTGSIVASGVSTSRLVSVSVCRSTASCVGGADETKTTIGYGPQSSGIANNLFPVIQSSGSGDGRLTATTASTWDAIGNRTYVDGALPGVQDTTRTLYDAARQVVGVIGPDPDGGGTLRNRAVKLTYNPDAQVTLVDQGTTAGQSDANWAAFASLQQGATTYDANARPVKQEAVAGGTTYALSQSNYDALGRVSCVAQRMDPAVWGSQSDACLPQTTGADGPDRISQTLYTDAGEVARIRVGLGTTDQANDQTFSYNLNGTRGRVTDGETNRTTFVYDGFDRLVTVRYPVTTQGADASSTTDVERYSYDPNGNVTQRRLRNLSNINFTYDALNRVTLKDLPGSEPDVSYAYDLLSQPTSANATTGVISFTYDALGRVTARSGPLGTLNYDYDLAGRRTKLKWPDPYYVTYDYLVTGETSVIREGDAPAGFVLATYGYDDLGRRGSVTRGNGTSTSYAYNAGSQLIGLTQNLAGTAQDLALTFAYNKAGQKVSTASSNDFYAFTGNTNRNIAETPDGLNRLVSQGSTALGYDTKGNVTSVGGASYAYTAENRLTSGPGASFAYDALGDLSSIPGSALLLSYDGPDLVGEYSAPATLQRRYVFGPSEDEPLVSYGGSGTGDRRWFHADERGSIVATSNLAGSATATYAYDEYGTPAPGTTSGFLYTGQYWLSGPSLYYYKARMYAPSLGRFMQTDPIGYGSGMNLYAYVGGDPINFADPTGLDRMLCYSATAGNYYVRDTGSSGVSPKTPCPEGPSGPDIVVTANPSSLPAGTQFNGARPRYIGGSIGGRSAPQKPASAPPSRESCLNNLSFEDVAGLGLDAVGFGASLIGLKPALSAGSALIGVASGLGGVNLGVFTQSPSTIGTAGFGTALTYAGTLELGAKAASNLPIVGALAAGGILAYDAVTALKKAGCF